MRGPDRQACWRRAPCLCDAFLDDGDKDGESESETSSSEAEGQGEGLQQAAGAGGASTPGERPLGWRRLCGHLNTTDWALRPGYGFGYAEGHDGQSVRSHEESLRHLAEEYLSDRTTLFLGDAVTRQLFYFLRHGNVFPSLSPSPFLNCGTHSRASPAVWRCWFVPTRKCVVSPPFEIYIPFIRCDLLAAWYTIELGAEEGEEEEEGGNPGESGARAEEREIVVSGRRYPLDSFRLSGDKIASGTRLLLLTCAPHNSFLSTPTNSPQLHC